MHVRLESLTYAFGTRVRKACMTVLDKLRNLFAVLASVAASLPW
jgi:hypothetical protein